MSSKQLLAQKIYTQFLEQRTEKILDGIDVLRKNFTLVYELDDLCILDANRIFALVYTEQKEEGLSGQIQLEFTVKCKILTERGTREATLYTNNVELLLNNEINNGEIIQCTISPPVVGQKDWESFNFYTDNFIEILKESGERISLTLEMLQLTNFSQSVCLELNKEISRICVDILSQYILFELSY